jgi:hypothetical protein
LASAAGLDALHQRRRQQRGRGVGHRQAELHGVAPRVEVARRQRLAQRGQGVAHLRPQRLGARRGAHAEGVRTNSSSPTASRSRAARG